jgi:two-component system, chemotaxis family, CheB/CheR fusion protein
MTDELTRPAAVDDLGVLLSFVKAERGFDFTGYKRGTLERRVAKRMQATGAASYVDYANYLNGHPEEFVELFNTILINVTTFLRDPPAWDYLAAEVIPRLLAQHEDGEPLRMWSAGCATGEEAFSLVIVLCEAMGEASFRRRVKIYATDLDDDALTIGRRGLYTAKQVENVSEELQEKYFERADSNYVFRGDLRRSVIFGKHDLIQDPPISRVDLLAARNTLMYFGPEAQARVLANFHFALEPNGFLFLGRSEMLLTRSRLFVPVELKRRVFSKVPLSGTRERLQGMVLPGDAEQRTPRIPDEVRLRDASAETGAVAQIVVDGGGALGLANAQARKLFGLTASDIGRPLQDLELSYRPVELRSQIEAATAEQQPVVVREVEWAAGGELRWFDVQVSSLIGADGEAIGTGITFSDVTRFRQLREAVEQSKETLETAYEELQSTAEELETTNEELQSTNEELETTNEEIQSTNEELETMNEELQSTNEELETINDELQERTDSLNEMNAFLESILGSLRNAVIVLDRDLRVQAWNEPATDLWGLRAEEVQAEHFLTIDIGLPVEHIATMLRGCLSSQSNGEAVLDATDRRGRSIRVGVNCSPLRGPDSDVRGVIVQMEVVED